MQSDLFEQKMRAMEAFHNISLLPGAYPILRVDGRSFTRFTGEYFEKPIDPLFRDLMVATAAALLEELHGVYAYTESDEISVLLPQDWDLFHRSLEKAVSMQRRGVGLYYEEYLKQGYNPQQQRAVETVRRRIKVDQELPWKDDYHALLQKLLSFGLIDGRDEPWRSRDADE